MDTPTETHLLSVCTALGAFESQSSGSKVYVPGDEVSACLKDIKRYLRIEEGSPSRDIFLLIGNWHVVELHIIPLLISPLTPPNIISSALELLVPLTWPVDLNSNRVSDQLAILRSIKNECCSQPVLPVILKEIMTLLAKDHKLRSEKEHASIYLLLTLIKNLVAITPGQSIASSSNEIHLLSNLSEKFIIEMDKHRVLDFLVAFAGSMSKDTYREWNILLLNILYHIFEGRDLSKLFAEHWDDKENQSSPSNNNNAITSYVGATLTSALLNEAQSNPSDPATLSSHRHGRFGGSFTFEFSNGHRVNALKSLHAVQNVRSTLDQNKKKPPLGRRQQQAYLKVSRGFESLELVLIYRKFTSKMLAYGFNAFVTSIKRDIDNERENFTSVENSKFCTVCAHFLKARGLFESNQRKYPEFKDSFDYDTVTGLVNLRGFVYLFKTLSIYNEEKDKKSEVIAVLNCLREMVATLASMSKSNDSAFTELSNNIQANLFYESHYHQIFLSLSKTIKSDSQYYLEIVVDAIHLFLKLLADYCKENNLKYVRAQRRQRQKRSVEGVTVDSDGETTIKTIEKEFNMDKIYFSFASETVIELYVRLLKYHERLPEKSIFQIASMFHRIVVQLKMPALFFKVSFLDIFHDILRQKPRKKSIPAWAELIKVVEYITSKLVSSMRQYPLLLVELLFSKSKMDCMRIQTGDVTEYSVIRISSLNNKKTTSEPEPEPEESSQE